MRSSSRLMKNVIGAGYARRRSVFFIRPWTARLQAMALSDKSQAVSKILGIEISASLHVDWVKFKKFNQAARKC